MEIEKKRELTDREVLIHTATLWKNKPIPTDEPEAYPEQKIECANVGKFHVIGARVRGKKHKHEGTNSDDWFETGDADKFTICVVSDGAGARKFSRIGAKYACVGAVADAKKHLTDYIKKHPNIYKNLSRELTSTSFQSTAADIAKIARNVVGLARKNVEIAFDERKHKKEYSELLKRPLELNDFASTILLTFATFLEDIGETFVISCQVGDGMTFAVNKDAKYEDIITLLGDADSGEFSGETEFLTSSKLDDITLQKKTKITRKKIDYIMSMTDGVADDYDPNKIHLLRLYLDLKLNRILNANDWEKIIKNMDDKTRYELSNKIPDPVQYDKENGKSMPIQYSIELMQKYNVNLKELWENNQADLAIMSSAITTTDDKNAGTKLFNWLDDYVVRGSFDDRTLVILENGGKKNG